MNKYILTVDWCDQGKRGVFADTQGQCFWKSEEDGSHTEDEMWKILGAFDMILSPKSILISEEEMKAYIYFIPLKEYSEAYGIVLTKETYEKEIPCEEEKE